MRRTPARFLDPCECGALSSFLSGTDDLKNRARWIKVQFLSPGNRVDGAIRGQSVAHGAPPRHRPVKERFYAHAGQTHPVGSRAGVRGVFNKKHWVGA